MKNSFTLLLIFLISGLLYSQDNPFDKLNFIIGD
jgi:hypothetical protein